MLQTLKREQCWICLYTPNRTEDHNNWTSEHFAWSNGEIYSWLVYNGFPNGVPENTQALDVPYGELYHINGSPSWKIHFLSTLEGYGVEFDCFQVENLSKLNTSNSLSLSFLAEHTLNCHH